MKGLLSLVFCLWSFIFGFWSISNVFAMGQVPSTQVKEGLIGSAAPDFTLGMTSGASKSLAQARQGKKAVLFLWATWCPHCHDGLLRMNEDAEAMDKAGIKIILVDLGESKEEVKEYLLRNRLNWDSFVDADNSLQEPYQLIGVPTLYFVDEKGIIRSIQHGFPSNYEELFSANK